MYSMEEVFPANSEKDQFYLQVVVNLEVQICHAKEGSIPFVEYILK